MSFQNAWPSADVLSTLRGTWTARRWPTVTVFAQEQCEVCHGLCLYVWVSVGNGPAPFCVKVSLYSNGVSTAQVTFGTSHEFLLVVQHSINWGKPLEQIIQHCKEWYIYHPSSSISYRFYSNTNLHEWCTSIITLMQEVVTFTYYCKRCERDEVRVVVRMLLFSDQTSMLT